MFVQHCREYRGLEVCSGDHIPCQGWAWIPAPQLRNSVSLDELLNTLCPPVSVRMLISQVGLNQCLKSNFRSLMEGTVQGENM